MFRVVGTQAFRIRDRPNKSHATATPYKHSKSSTHPVALFRVKGLRAEGILRQALQGLGLSVHTHTHTPNIS